jgi:hypothetical protein
MSTNSGLNKIKQWRRPRVYRTTYVYGAREIYQIEIMDLYSLWSKICTPEKIEDYELRPFALVCVHVYSRFAYRVSMESRRKQDIRKAIYWWYQNNWRRFTKKPNVISGDAEIISAISDEDGNLYF